MPGIAEDAEVVSWASILAEAALPGGLADTPKRKLGVDLGQHITHALNSAQPKTMLPGRVVSMPESSIDLTTETAFFYLGDYAKSPAGEIIPSALRADLVFASGLDKVRRGWLEAKLGTPSRTQIPQVIFREPPASRPPVVVYTTSTPRQSGQVSKSRSTHPTTSK